jgi:hypothetical protein
MPARRDTTALRRKEQTMKLDLSHWNPFKFFRKTP